MPRKPKRSKRKPVSETELVEQSRIIDKALDREVSRLSEVADGPLTDDDADTMIETVDDNGEE